ncbi:S16 family serine protease [Cohnella sp. AR92]|uniref:S16 family serine protease n=1 Tax=Cohnella sp. AR92 TaxID=648716 RepID=UPI000F8F1238|nr:S16 family serine protease [Cohnella sp. AR92]RUS44904.1 hypothetical protein ELR57_21850 [Cohnella sp. AR92]
MFDFIHDPLATIYLVLAIALIPVIFIIIRHPSILIRRSRKKAKVRWDVISLVVVEVALIYLFIVRGYSYYQVVLTGGTFSDSVFISSKYANQREGHFHSLYTQSSAGLKEPYKGLYRVYEKEKAVAAFREKKIPFSNDTLKDEYDFSHAYAEPATLSLRAPISASQSNVLSNKALFQQSEQNSVVVAERLLGRKLPEDVLETNTSSYAGNSAGMMLTLELVQQFGDVDLLKGYSVCGTGTIEENGEIGSIGSLRMKLISAEREHFDYCIVAQDNYRAALGYLKEEQLSIKLIPVSNIQEALTFLNALPVHES